MTMTRTIQTHEAAADRCHRREKLIAEAVRDVAAELRLTDLNEIAQIIAVQHHPNIGDLVSSSAERFFTEGTLAYSWASKVQLTWGRAPVVALDLEFRHEGVMALFELELTSADLAVDLHSIHFERRDTDPDANTGRLAAALSAARRLPL